MRTEKQSKPLTGEIQHPEFRTLVFKNADAALDFCKMAQPKSMTLNAIYEGGFGKEPRIVEWQLQYKDSEGL